MAEETVNYGILDDIQRDVANTIQNDLQLCSMAECDDYEKAMGGALAGDGVFVLVSIPEAQFREVQSPRVILDPITVAITVTVAKKGLSASGLALKCAQNLVMRTPTECNRPLVFSGGTSIVFRHTPATDTATVTLTTSTAFSARNI